MLDSLVWRYNSSIITEKCIFITTGIPRDFFPSPPESRSICFDPAVSAGFPVIPILVRLSDTDHNTAFESGIMAGFVISVRDDRARLG